MTKQEALDKVLFTLGAQDTSNIALAADQPQEANTFHYVRKRNKRRTCWVGRAFEAYEEGDVIVEVVTPEDDEQGWQVRRLQEVYHG